MSIYTLIFTPSAINLFASALGGLAKGLAWLDETIPILVPIVGGFAFSVMSLVVVLKTATLAKIAFKYVTLSLRKSIVLTTAANFYSALSFGAVDKSSVLARSKLLLFSASSKIATGAMWLFNTAMKANPITKVVTLLTALGTGAVYLYKNFEPFTTFVDSIWSKLKGFFSFVTSGWSAVGGIVSSIGSYLGLGGDESRLKIPTTPKKTAVAFASAAALSSPVAMASQASVEPRAVNQTITMQVTVNNPSSNVDVERAIANAMRDRSAISLTDEDI